MRALGSLILGVVMSLTLVAGVATAAPGQSSWDSDSFTGWDPCTNENVDQTFTVHFVDTDSLSHFNFHSVGVGETTGASYVGIRAGTDIVHALSDGTFMRDFAFNIFLVSQGPLSNQYFTGRIHVVLDQYGNVISGTMTFDAGCHG
jgi:hypothetical protein